MEHNRLQSDNEQMSEVDLNYLGQGSEIFHYGFLKVEKDGSFWTYYLSVLVMHYSEKCDFEKAAATACHV